MKSPDRPTRRPPAGSRAGCPPAGKPPVVEIAGNPAPPGTAACWLEAGDGVTLRALFSTGRGERGSLLVFPGRTEFAEIHFELLRAARADGLATGILDWRGQGASTRPLADARKGHVDRFRDYLRDAGAFARAARAAGLPRPWHLLGNSMGAALAWLHAAGDRPDRLVLVAPMLGLRLPLHRRLAETVARAGSRLGLAESYLPGVDRRTVCDRGFAGNVLTGDRVRFERVFRLQQAAPELALGGPTWRWLAEALTATRRLQAGSLPDLPVLALLAAADRVVDNRRAEALLRPLPLASVHLLPGSRHCPLLERDPVWRDAVGRILAFTREGARQGEDRAPPGPVGGVPARAGNCP